MSEEKGFLNPVESKTIYFFKRGEEYFAAQETEAWDLVYADKGWRRKDIEFVGSSDGRTHNKIISESRSKTVAMNMEAEQLREDLLSVDQKSNEFIILKAKLRKLNKQIEALNKDVVKEAFNAELEVAKKNPILPPRKANIIAIGDKDTIMREMGGRL